jgi:hypothetical protein
MIPWPKDTKGSSFSFGIFWPWYHMSFFNFLLLITPLVSFGHGIICRSSIYGFWLLLWYLLAMVLYVVLRFTASDYSFGILWPWYYMSFFGFWLLLWYLVAMVLYVVLRFLITPLVSCGHCILCRSSFVIPWPQDTKGVIRNRRTTYNTMATRYQRSNQKPKNDI